MFISLLLPLVLNLISSCYSLANYASRTKLSPGLDGVSLSRVAKQLSLYSLVASQAHVPIIHPRVTSS
jgi:hypothetical protein